MIEEKQQKRSKLVSILLEGLLFSRPSRCNNHLLFHLPFPLSPFSSQSEWQSLSASHSSAVPPEPASSLLLDQTKNQNETLFFFFLERKAHAMDNEGEKEEPTLALGLKRGERPEGSNVVPSPPEKMARGNRSTVITKKKKKKRRTLDQEENKNRPQSPRLQFNDR